MAASRPEENRTHHRLAEVFRRDRGRLLRFVRAKLGDTAELDAEDLVSDTLLRLFERADLISEVENVTAYLLRALANGAIDRIRRRRDGVALSDALQDPGPQPDATLERSQLQRRLRQALDRLPPAQRAVWVAVEIEGASFRDLAEKWNEPIGTLLSRKSRATKSLRAWLMEEET